MRCIAIDDEPKALFVMRNYVSKTPFISLLKEFRSGIDAIEFLQREPIDLIFLDINMPDLTGIEFLQSLSSTPTVIFTTAYPEYAIQSYEWDTVGYLLKPIAFNKYLKAVNKANALYKLKSQSATIEREENTPDFLLIKSGPQTHQLALKDILYVEASGNHVYFFTQEKKIISLQSLKEVSEMLPATLFHRIHKSFIISTLHIEVIERHQATVKGKVLPIGKTYREAFLKKFKH